MSAKDGLKLIVVIGAQLCGHIFSWLLHNMGLNCMGELIHRFFFQSVLSDVWLVDSGCRARDSKDQLQISNQIFSWVGICRPNPYIV